MGEYAKRLRDGAEIKIGTCSSMYYCRYEQLNDIIYHYPTNNLLWRIPAIEEDGIEVGNFKFRGLYENDGFPLYSVRLWNIPEDSELMGMAEDKGNVQLHSDKLGLLLNVPCHHGLKLPDNTGDIKAFFNGRRNPLHLCFLKNTDTELRVGVKCAACGEMWSFSFNDIEPCIISEDMKLRLLKMCSDYYFEHTNDVASYSATEKNERGHYISILPLGGDYWRVMNYEGRTVENGQRVMLNGKIVWEGSWEESVKEFNYYLRYADRQNEGGGK